MARGRKKQPIPQQNPHHPPPHTAEHQSPATTSAAPPPSLNRTRDKLPTKRKKLRQEAASAAASGSTTPSTQLVPGAELVVVMPRYRPAHHRQTTGDGNTSRGGGKAGRPYRPPHYAQTRGGESVPRGAIGGGRGGNRFDKRHSYRGLGFTLRDEALNTNDNYYGRTWMDDKRSTLRHQAVLFVEGGILSNKPLTPSTSEAEDEPPVPVDSDAVPAMVTSNDADDTDEASPEVEDQVTEVETVVNVSESSILPPTSSTRDTDELAPGDADALSPVDSSISRFHGTDSSNASAPAPNRNAKPSLPTSSTVPLPPVQFISSDENIVFTPRNQRNPPVQPTQSPNNWEIPATFRDMTQTATDWTKPRKRPNRNAGTKQYRYDSDPERGQIEYLSPVYGLPMTTTAEDALMDYLENVRGQAAESSDDEQYIDKALEKANIVHIPQPTVVEHISKLSLDDTKRSRSVETRKKVSGPLLVPSNLARFSLSASATPLRTTSPESPAPFNSVVGSDVEPDEMRIQNSPIVSTGGAAENGAWMANSDPDKTAAANDSSSESDLEARGPIRRFRKWELIDEDAQSDDSDVDDEEEEEEEEEEDDVEAPVGDIEEPDEDFNPSDIAISEDDIIANMLLDEYEIDNIGYPQLSKSLTKISRIHQRDVPALPQDDPDIPDHLHEMWAKDRLTKKDRKKERELARLQGLLGSKSKSLGKNVRRASRREEMKRTDELDGFVEVNMREINEELRNFMEADDLTDYALPPMHRLARKTVHELARAYNLGSKSHGNGSSRYTTLFKLRTTTPIDEFRIARILKRSSHISALERADSDANRSQSYRDQARSSRLRDGDIVGGDAKEISSDNRGRVMLEKLGWRTGMGLGAEGVGITIPLVAVVKKTKSGLQ